MQDPYKLLGVTPDVSRAELDLAFRQLAKSIHPDRNPADPEATERFRQVHNRLSAGISLRHANPGLPFHQTGEHRE